MSSPKVTSDYKIIVTWLYDDIQKGLWVRLAAGLGVAYYVGGGLPNQGQSMMQIAQAYLAGGVANLALDMAGVNN